MPYIVGSLVLALIFYVMFMLVLAPRWDREAPSDPESPVGKFSELDPLTLPPHPPHTQK